MIKIPEDLVSLCEKREGLIYYDFDRSSAAKKVMNEIGIPNDSEFYAFFSTFVINNMWSDHSLRDLSPIIESNGSINPGVKFAWEIWEIPVRYIAMTSLEGEGGYFYDKETGAVIDYENGSLDAVLKGDVNIIDGSLFGFMRWFLS